MRRAIERTLRRAIIIAKWLPSMLRIERQRAEDRTIIQRYFTRIGIMINRKMQKGLVDIPILQNFEFLALLPECFQIQRK